MNSFSPLLALAVLALQVIPLRAPAQPAAASPPAQVDPATGLPIHPASAKAPAPLDPVTGLPIALGKYPPARQALVQIQQRDAREFAAGRGYSKLFQELADVNGALKEDDATCVLFKALAQADPVLARLCYLFAEPLLVRQGDYALCLSCLGDVPDRFEILVHSYQVRRAGAAGFASHRLPPEPERPAGLSMPAPVLPSPAERLKLGAQDDFVGQVCRWVEILVGTGRRAEAERLRERASGIVKDARLESALSDAEANVQKVLVSPRKPPSQRAVLVMLTPDPTVVDTNFAKPAASIERWSPPLAPGQKPDFEKMRQEMDDLTATGHYEDALQRHIWYHNHALEFDSAQKGVRLSYGLADWVELGRRYPRARQALMEVRDAGTRDLVEGRGSFGSFQEVAAINREFGAEAATEALFASIRQRSPALAQPCYELVEEVLVNRHQYAVCLDCLGDFQARADNLRRTWESRRKWQEGRARTAEESRKRIAAAQAQTGGAYVFAALPEPPDFANRDFIARTRRLVEILIGTGHPAEAAKLQAEALAVLDDERLQSAVADAERRVRD